MRKISRISALIFPLLKIQLPTMEIDEILIFFNGAGSFTLCPGCGYRDSFYCFINSPEDLSGKQSLFFSI